MSTLQKTMEAMYEAMADVPAAPAAWVPLRRATVEEALRVLGAVQGALAPMKALAAELEGERQEPVLLWQRGGVELVAASQTMVHNGNGHVTVLPVEPAHQMEAEVVGIDDDAKLRIAVYAEMRRLALGSAGPSKTRWDDERAPELPKSDELIERLGSRWIVLVKDAGLMPPNAGPRRNVPAPAEVEVAADEADPFRG